MSNTAFTCILQTNIYNDNKGKQRLYEAKEIT